MGADVDVDAVAALAWHLRQLATILRTGVACIVVVSRKPAFGAEPTQQRSMTKARSPSDGHDIGVGLLAGWLSGNWCTVTRVCVCVRGLDSSEVQAASLSGSHRISGTFVNPFIQGITLGQASIGGC